MNRFVWRRLDLKTWAIVVTPESHLGYPENKGDLVRARFPATINLSVLNQKETKVDYLMQLHIGIGETLGGKVLNYFMNLYLAKNLKRVVDMQQYFQKLRPLNSLDDNDGRAIGVAFNLQRAIESKKSGWFGGKHVERCVEVVMKENKSLQENWQKSIRGFLVL